MVFSIGIRELRQNASKYLRRVKAGETITITDRGEPVAEIRPVKQTGSVVARLIAEGRATPAAGDIRETLAKHPPVQLRPGERPLSELLAEMRDEERA